ASARKKKGDSTSSTTPPTPTPTTIVVATTPTEPTDVQRTEAEQLKIVLKRSKKKTHISQQRSSGTDEGTGSRPGVPNVPSNDSEEELSWNSSDDEDVGGKSDEEETRQEEGGSFDPIPITPEGSEEESNDEEDQELRLSEEARIQEEEADELYRD
nr:hypothetical protein [Tanacetum cinerariifolium]